MNEIITINTRPYATLLKHLTTQIYNVKLTIIIFSLLFLIALGFAVFFGYKYYQTTTNLPVFTEKTPTPTYTASPTLLSPSPASTSDQEITKQIGIINKAYYKNELPYIDIDYIEWINDDSSPNGFKIKNDNPLIRTFEVSPTAPVYLIDFTKSEMIHPLVSFDELKNYLNNTSPNYNLGPELPPFWIQLNNQDQVQEIKQQYIP